MNKGKKTVLAIDDEITTLSAIRNILEGFFDVCLAKNAEIAMTILKTTEVDLILLDMEMPNCSGMEILEDIGKNPKYYHIPVIMVSSHGQADIIIQAKNAGAKAFIVKPINPKTLLDKINAVLKTSLQKINKDVLYRKLDSMAAFCKQGSSVKVEALMAELGRVYCDMATDAEVAAICKHAKNLDYILVIDKIHRLLKARR
ncbi:MAG: response regulator [Treponema sp.]|nr:response regulator [Treponema sp.]